MSKRTRFLEAQQRITARPLPQMAQVQGPQAAQLGQVAGPTAATFERTAAPQAATLGQAGQDVRGMQMAGLEQLQQRASGAAPTIAEQQMQRGLEQQLAAQAAQANVGGSPLAQRQAQMQGAQAMQQTDWAIRNSCTARTNASRTSFASCNSRCERSRS